MLWVFTTVITLICSGVLCQYYLSGKEFLVWPLYINCIVCTHVSTVEIFGSLGCSWLRSCWKYYYNWRYRFHPWCIEQMLHEIVQVHTTVLNIWICQPNATALVPLDHDWPPCPSERSPRNRDLSLCDSSSIGFGQAERGLGALLHSWGSKTLCSICIWCNHSNLAASNLSARGGAKSLTSNENEGTDTPIFLIRDCR